MTQMSFVQCPVCGGEMIEKDVKQLFRDGSHIAVVIVREEVHLRCGERLYPQETVCYFAHIRAKRSVKNSGLSTVGTIVSRASTSQVRELGSQAVPYLPSDLATASRRRLAASARARYRLQPRLMPSVGCSIHG